MAGLLTRPGHRAFPVLHQWQKFDVRFCGLTAAGTVPDFYRVPFSFGRRKPPETIFRLQNYLFLNRLVLLLAIFNYVLYIYYIKGRDGAELRVGLK